MACPPINSALLLLFAFFPTAFFWESFFFSLLLCSLLLWVQKLENSFVPVILCCDTRLLLVILYRDNNLSSSEFHLVRVLLLLVFLLLLLLVLWSWFLVGLGIVLGKSLASVCFEFWHFVGVLGFFEGFFSDCFGLGFVYFLGYLCFTHCASLYVDSVFVVRDGCKKDCFVFLG